MRTALKPKFIPPFRGGVAPDSLLTGLESYWTLDELSGVRADSVGPNDLTDNNTVTYVNDGPRGVNAKFVRVNNEYLEGGKTSLTGDGSISGWIRFSDNTVYQLIFANGDGSTRQFELSSLGGVTGILASVHTDAVSVEFTYADTSLRMIDNQWHNIVMTYSHTVDRKIRIYIDGELVGTSTATTGNLIDTMNVSRIGGWTFGYTEGNTSRVGVWTKILSGPEITELYNSGRGKSYADLSAGIKTNLVSYWNLSEVNDSAGPITRVDSHGANNLTDNNTVQSINNGPEAVVANFSVATNEFLNRAALNAFGGDYTVSLWVKSKVTGATYYFFSAENGPYIYWNNAVSGFSVTHGTGTASVISIVPGVTEWHHVVLKSLGGNVTIRVDDSLENTVAHNTPAETLFMLGGVSGVGSLDGYMSNVGIWSSALSAAQITELFNSGVGKKYSELSAGIKTNLVSYWNLTELAGNRADSHGANTLTDNNTVLSVINMPDVADKISAKFTAATSESLTIASPVSPAAPHEWSMALWAYVPSSNPDYATLADGGDGGADPGHWGLYKVAAVGGLQLLSRVQMTLNANIVLDAWNFIYFQFDGNTPCTAGLSANNAALVTGPPTVDRLTDIEFRIGHSTGAGGSYFTGIIDEVGVWSRILTPAERTRLFNLGKGYFYPFVP